MGLFSRKKKAVPENNLDIRVYAFIGLGMMARFMKEQQLAELVEALPAMIAPEVGTSRNNVVVVHGADWLADGNEFANSINFDGTPAYPDAAMKLCEDYLKNRGLYKHMVGDRQLLGILANGSITMGTCQDLIARGEEVNGASILITSWLAFHYSALKA